MYLFANSVALSLDHSSGSITLWLFYQHSLRVAGQTAWQDQAIQSNNKIAHHDQKDIHSFTSGIRYFIIDRKSIWGSFGIYQLF